MCYIACRRLLSFSRMKRRSPRSTLFPYTTLFRSSGVPREALLEQRAEIRAMQAELGDSLTLLHGVELGLHRADLRSEEHTSELQSLMHLVCRLLLEEKKLIRLLCEVISETHHDYH